MKILVADQDPSVVVNVIKELLTDGISVEIVADSQQVIGKAVSRDIDVCILNLDIEEESIVYLAEKLRELSPLQPLIVLVRKASSSLETKIRKHGVFYYGFSAIVPQHLHSIVRAALKERMKNIENLNP